MKMSMRQRGDTIVEVLIAILVVSSILAGAFVSARRSQSAIRQSQERVEALNVAEGQMERVKALAQSANSGGLYGPGTEGQPFCVKLDTNERVAETGTPPSDLSTDTFDTTTVYNGDCQIIPNAGVPYYVHIVRDSSNTFTVRVRWDGVNGIGKQEVMLALRVDQP